MKTLQSFCSVIVLFLISNTSCSREDTSVVAAASLTKNDMQEVNLNLGEEKSLTRSVGDVPKQPVVIKFIDVKEGRCATENCISCYGGYVRVTFTVKSGTITDSLTLSRISCIGTDDLKPGNQLFDQKEVLGLNIGLANVSELSNVRPINLYNVKLLIREL